MTDTFVYEARYFTQEDYDAGMDSTHREAVWDALAEWGGNLFDSMDKAKAWIVECHDEAIDNYDEDNRDADVSTAPDTSGLHTWAAESETGYSCRWGWTDEDNFAWAFIARREVK